MAAVFLGLGGATAHAVPSTIRIISPNGVTQFGVTTVYVNGVLRGQTAPNGLLQTNLNAGDKIVIRRKIREGVHYKGSHNYLSNSNWNFRVYITNVRVNNDGSTTPYTVTNPNVNQNVALRSDSPLVGLNWVVSCQWDLTFAEREDMRQRIRDASAYLYNATDGQFFIEQTRLTDRAVNWLNADATVVTNYNLREYVKPYGGGFLEKKTDTLSFMNMCRRSIPETYIHEFGHYGLSLGDEYKDDVASAICTTKLDTASASFSRDKPRASCMMYQHKDAPKICSDVAENPHNENVGLKEIDCWSRIQAKYGDFFNFARYRFRTPATRGVAVGKVVLPVADWTTVIQTYNTDLPNLIAPVTLDTTGTSLPAPYPFQKKSVVWSVEAATGRWLYQGNVWFNGAKPTDNQLKLAGLHAGDYIVADAFIIASVGEGGLITGMKSRNYVASLRTAPLQRSTFTPQLDPNWLPMTMGAGFAGDGQHLEVTLKSPTPFAGAPTLEFQPTGRAEGRITTQTVRVRQVDATTFIARIPIESDHRSEGVLIARGRSADGRGATVVRPFAATEPDRRDLSQVADPSGSLLVRMETPAVNRRERIVVGPSEMPEPSMPGWFTLVEAKKVTREAEGSFNTPISLVFQVDTPDETEEQTLTERMNFEYQIVKWTPERGWVPVTTVQHPSIDVATHATSEPGHYALLARLGSSRQ